MNIIFEPDHGYYHHKGKLSTLDLEKVATFLVDEAGGGRAMDKIFT